MMPLHRNQVRQDQTRAEFDVLTASIQSWQCEQQAADNAGRHYTQLQAIASTLTSALDTLCRELAAIDAARDPGEVYDECRDVDQAVVWLRRLWEYFREKFDQHAEPERLGPLLRAADEVVWSCYRQAFAKLGSRDPSVMPKPPPLTYVESQYSPAAIQANRPLPPALQPDASLYFLDRSLTSLPIPVLRLPPWCIDAPWWLVFVGHEVGHHVQRDLNLGGYFRQGLEHVAHDHCLGARASAWGTWSIEIFADVFSLLVMGPWALWALAEVELSIPGEMAKPGAAYPAPAVRLALMAAAAERLGMSPAPALRGLDLRALATCDARSAQDMGVVGAAVDFALGPLRDNLGTLPDLLGFSAERFAPGERVARWADHLRSEEDISTEARLETAREVTAAAVCAWAAIAEVEDPERRRRGQAALAARVKKALVRNAAPGVRAREGEETHALERGRELAARLLDTARGLRAPSPAEE